MKKLSVLVVVSFLSVSGLYANKDSIGVKNVNGRVFIMHKVTAGEGLYALSRRYNVDVNRISAENPGSEKGLLLGQVIMVPMDRALSSVSPSGTPVPPKTYLKPATPTDVNISPKKEARYHTVKAGETLYRIATNNNMSVQQLKSLNDLAGNTIEVGQKLLISGNKTALTGMDEVSLIQRPVLEGSQTRTMIAEVAASTPEPVPGMKSTNAGGPKGNEYIDNKYQSQYDDYQRQLTDRKRMGRITLKEVEESVVASAIDDGSIVSHKSLALHRSAPPGTIIQVKNPMNGKVVYVKVIATLPPEAADGNVSIKITKTAADQLGILDKYFRVSTHYSMEVIK